MKRIIIGSTAMSFGIIGSTLALSYLFIMLYLPAWISRMLFFREMILGLQEHFFIMAIRHIPFVVLTIIAFLGFVLCVWGLLKSKGEIMGKIIFGFALMLSGVASITIFISSALMMEEVASMFLPLSDTPRFPISDTLRFPIAAEIARLSDDIAVPIVFSAITAALGIYMLIRGLIERKNKEIRL